LNFLKKAVEKILLLRKNIRKKVIKFHFILSKGEKEMRRNKRQGLALITAFFTVLGLVLPFADTVTANTTSPTIQASVHDELAFQQQEKMLDLTILHTNDTHAHLENVPYMHTAIKAEKKKHPNALLLNAGDVFSGTLYFNQYLGQADLEFMNKIGYDAMTFGNHEFDKKSNVLADFIKGTNFPIVSANVNVEKDEELSPLKKNEIGVSSEGGKIYPAIIKEINGVEVGIIGLTTEETEFLANPSEGVVFENAQQKALETITLLKEQDINHIIVLSHLGVTADKKLAENVQGIDVIVGGHTHTKLIEPIVVNETTEPTVIVQASEYAQYLGKLQANFNDKGIVTSWNGTLLDILEQNEDGKYTYPADEWTSLRLQELSEPIEELKNTVVGYTEVPLNGERGDVRTQETNLGNAVTDAMLSKANESIPTQIAMQNGGGIRASINEGDVTLGEVLTVMPFGNTLVTLELSGEEIIQALEHSVSRVEEEAGQFMQVSGLHFSFDPNQPAGERVYGVEVKTGSGYEAIDPVSMYNVATNAFVADGGDGYTMFRNAKDEGRMKELFFVDYEVMAEYLEANSPISPQVEVRIAEGEMPEENICKNPHPGKQKGHDKQDSHKKGNGKKKGHEPCKADKVAA
jgi:2',3'-cyclic-nucleotide 2'-phosphodiesterase (5'-nucleotidase family)